VLQIILVLIVSALASLLRIGPNVVPPLPFQNDQAALLAISLSDLQTPSVV
jgi:hypothetical protein